MARRQLRAAGLSDPAISRLARAGVLDRVHSGVYLLAGAPFSHPARLHAAQLACDGAVGFASAAHWWGTEEITPPVVHLVVDPGRTPRVPPRTTVHRVFVPVSAITRHEGLLVTTRTWTLLDHLGTVPPHQATRLADRALQRQWLTPEDIERRLRDFPGRAGNRQLRRLLAASRDGAAAESERILHRLLRRARIDGWTANLRVAGRI